MMDFRPIFAATIEGETPQAGEFVATTDGKLFVGTEAKWIPYASVIVVKNHDDLATMQKYQYKIYVVDNIPHIWDGVGLIALGSPVQFVPVESITNVPLEANVGEPLALSGTVHPGNATNRTIVWTVQNAGTTGATLKG